jgi:hypothetical protein
MKDSIFCNYNFSEALLKILKIAETSSEIASTRFFFNLGTDGNPTELNQGNKADVTILDIVLTSTHER